MAVEEDKIEEDKDIPSIYVGRKPLSRYIASCFTMINNHDKIWIEGMGQSISKVVDIVNYFKRLYTQGKVRISDFQIDMVAKNIVHGLPKHTSRLRILLEVERNKT